MVIKYHMNQQTTKASLTAKQSRFIDNLLAGIGTQERCAIEAGYSERSAKVEASRLLRKTAILTVLAERARMSLRARCVSALQTVSKLSQDANSEYVRLEASKDILDRAGIRDDSTSHNPITNAIQVNIDLS